MLRYLLSRLEMETGAVVKEWQGNRHDKAIAEKARMERLADAMKGASPADIQVLMPGVTVSASVGKATKKDN